MNDWMKPKLKFGKDDFDYLSLSYGGGVQSSAMLVMAVEGVIPRPDWIIFADVGAEPQYVYDYVKVMSNYVEEHGMKVITAMDDEGLMEHELRVGNKRTLPPYYTKGKDGKPTPIRRKCTSEKKIDVIRREMRQMMGLKKGQRVKKKIGCMIGISIDEIQRMKDSRDKWQTNLFPLCDLLIDRQKCEQIVVDAGLPKPVKSSCIICPYHDDHYWSWMKKEHREEFDQAVEVDKKIRNKTAAGVDNPCYLHPSLKPLGEVDFDKCIEERALKKRKGHMDLFEIMDFRNECDGMCGV